MSALYKLRDNYSYIKNIDNEYIIGLAADIVEEQKKFEIQRISRIKVIESLRKNFLNKNLNQYKRIEDFFKREFGNDKNIRNVYYSRDETFRSTIAFKITLYFKNFTKNGDSITIYISDKFEENIFTDELLDNAIKYQIKHFVIPTEKKVIAELVKLKKETLKLLDMYNKHFKNKFTSHIKKDFINAVIYSEHSVVDLKIMR